MGGYNITRTVEQILDSAKDDKHLPSFTVHLHPEYWTLNNGSKFLYNNPVASLLDDIRAQRIPVDFLELFDSAKVPFYDGCMVVELLDYRPQKTKETVPDKPDRTRVVLHPNPETLWADICLLNSKGGNKWTDQDALDIEARILMATAPPLCLDPDPHLTRIANSVLRVSTPTTPISLKRKASVLDPEDEQLDKARKAKYAQYLNPTVHRNHGARYKLLELIQNNKAGLLPSRPPSTVPQQPPQNVIIPPPASIQTAHSGQSQSSNHSQAQNTMATPPSNATDSSKRPAKRKKTDASQNGFINDNVSRASATPTPTPTNGNPIPAHLQHLQQIPNGHHSPSPSIQVSSMQQQPQNHQQQQAYQRQNPQGQIPPQPSHTLRPVQQLPQNGYAPSASLPNFQNTVPMPNATFFNQNPPQRGQPKPGQQQQPNATAQQLLPHQQPIGQLTHAQIQAMQSQNSAQMQAFYTNMLQQQQQVAFTAQRLSVPQQQGQNGGATPQSQPSRSPVNATAAAQRSSPMLSNAQTTANPAFVAMQQNQNYPNHLRAAMANSQMPMQMVSGENGVQANGGGVGGPPPQGGQPMQMSSPEQQQEQQISNAQQMMYQQMYAAGYPQQGYRLPDGRAVPGYATWSVRGGMPMPVVNGGQHQIAGMPPNGGQMVNVGKITQGPMPAR